VRKLDYVIYALVILLIAYLVVSGPPYVVVSSYSMVPSLFPGDLVLVTRNPTTINVGDVIVYRVPEGTKPPFKPGTLVIHRVVNVVDDELITKGDNNSVPDQPMFVPKLTVDDVYGKAILVIPYVGWVSLTVQGSFHVLIVAIIVVASMYALARALG